MHVRHWRCHVWSVQYIAISCLVLAFCGPLPANGGRPSLWTARLEGTSAHHPAIVARPSRGETMMHQVRSTSNRQLEARRTDMVPGLKAATSEFHGGRRRHSGSLLARPLHSRLIVVNRDDFEIAVLEVGVAHEMGGQAAKRFLELMLFLLQELSKALDLLLGVVDPCQLHDVPVGLPL